MRQKWRQYFILVCIIGCSFTFCTKNLTYNKVIYSNDFNDSTNGNLELIGWVNGMTQKLTENRITEFNNNIVLGKLNNNLVLLDFKNLEYHQMVRVEFDLYLHNNWNGAIFVFQTDNQYQLITSFSNDSTVKQSYPNWFGNGSPQFPAGNQAQEIYLPGVCNLISTARGSSWYKIIRTIPHQSNSLSVSLSDAGGAVNDTCYRSWSIDNLKISLLHN